MSGVRTSPAPPSFAGAAAEAKDAPRSPSRRSGAGVRQPDNALRTPAGRGPVGIFEFEISNLKLRRSRPGAHSSVGQSTRLISAGSVVQVHLGPPSFAEAAAEAKMPPAARRAKRGRWPAGKRPASASDGKPLFGFAEAAAGGGDETMKRRDEFFREDGGSGGLGFFQNPKSAIQNAKSRRFFDSSTVVFR